MPRQELCLANALMTIFGMLQVAEMFHKAVWFGLRVAMDGECMRCWQRLQASICPWHWLLQTVSPITPRCPMMTWRISCCIGGFQIQPFWGAKVTCDRILWYLSNVFRNARNRQVMFWVDNYYHIRTAPRIRAAQYRSGCSCRAPSWSNFFPWSRICGKSPRTENVEFLFISPVLSEAESKTDHIPWAGRRCVEDGRLPVGFLGSLHRQACESRLQFTSSRNWGVSKKCLDLSWFCSTFQEVSSYFHISRQNVEGNILVARMLIFVLILLISVFHFFWSKIFIFKKHQERMRATFPPSPDRKPTSPHGHRDSNP